MSDYNTQENIGLLTRMGMLVLKFVSFIGILIAIAGLIMCFTGVGVIAGIPSIAVGLLVGRVGLLITRDSSHAASKRSGCLLKILGFALLLFILFLIYPMVVMVIYLIRNNGVAPW